MQNWICIGMKAELMLKLGTLKPKLVRSKTYIYVGRSIKTFVKEFCKSRLMSRILHFEGEMWLPASYVYVTHEYTSYIWRCQAIYRR